MKQIHITKATGGWRAEDTDGNVVTTALDKEACIHQTAEAAEQMGEPVSVMIHREDGTFEEERTYPRSADPSRSSG